MARRPFFFAARDMTEQQLLAELSTGTTLDLRHLQITYEQRLRDFLSKYPKFTGADYTKIDLQSEPAKDYVTLKRVLDLIPLAMWRKNPYEGTPGKEESKPSRETHKRRRDLINRYCKGNTLTRADLARRAGTSVTAIQGMVRGDKTRYSQDTLVRFLKTIGVSSDLW